LLELQVVKISGRQANRAANSEKQLQTAQRVANSDKTVADSHKELKIIKKRGR